MPTLEITDNAPRAILAVLEEGLAAHAREQGVEPPVFRQLAVLHHNEQGRIDAGLCGRTFWDSCYVDSLWVHPSLRRKGLGTALMKAAEQEARKRGSKTIYLWTQSFDAPRFYEKQGYRQFVAMPDFPKGHQHLGFVKQLTG